VTATEEDIERLQLAGDVCPGWWIHWLAWHLV